MRSHDSNYTGDSAICIVDAIDPAVNKYLIQSRVMTTGEHNTDHNASHHTVTVSKRSKCFKPLQALDSNEL